MVLLSKDEKVIYTVNDESGFERTFDDKKAYKDFVKAYKVLYPVSKLHVNETKTVSKVMGDNKEYDL